MKVLRALDTADRWFFLGTFAAAAGAWWYAGEPGAVLLVIGSLAAIAGALGGTR